MTPETAFALTNPAKAESGLIARDEEQFAAIGSALRRRVAELEARLAALLRSTEGTAQDAVERDAGVRRLGGQLRLLRRFGIDLCLGRMVPTAAAPDAIAPDEAEVGASAPAPSLALASASASASASAPDPIYVGRIGLTDDDGRRLLVDWRSPAAEPFFAATHGHPLGLVSRRRYRWTHGRVGDYWDEVFALGSGTSDVNGADRTAGAGSPVSTDGLGHVEPTAALDDQSAFIASLGDARSGHMRDVLATIQADQDAVIRADARGPLVVDGGPGTGKTVVALHRAAYLLYSDPRLGEGRGGVLFVGPSGAYLDYVDDVLPSLGEDGVQTCTVRDLVPEGASALPEPDARIATLKGRAEMVRAIEPAVALYEEPPTGRLVVETPWANVTLVPADWAQAFAVPDPGTPHNEARAQVWDALVQFVAGRVMDEAVGDDGRYAVDGGWGDDGWDDDGWGDGGADDGVDEPADAWSEGWGDASYGRADGGRADGGRADGGRGGSGHGGSTRAVASAAQVRRALAQHEELTGAFNRAWPVLDPAQVVADLWSVPAYLRRCAPWLTPAEVALLRRDDTNSGAGSGVSAGAGADAVPVRAWTTSDLPLLDAARERIGDARASAREGERQAAIAARREYMASIVDDLIAADDSEMGVMSVLRGQDAQNSLIDDDALPAVDFDALAGPFAHLLVDEAQELTDAEWAMLLRRCPSRSLTIVGDRAQARHGFTQTWQQRLERVGLHSVAQASLTINYRTPEEVMAAAEPVIRAVFPDANVPTSVRTSGVPVRYGPAAELARILGAWLAENDGVACVVVAPDPAPSAPYSESGMNLSTGSTAYAARGMSAADPASAGVASVVQAAGDRVRLLTPETCKGLEFDLVVLIDPESFGDGIEGAVDRYVAMTRATRQLVVLAD
jgi:hypothetical protein